MLCCAVLSLTQAPHIHFLLLEAADILRLHPLPRVHVVQAPAPFVRLLRIPLSSSTPHKQGSSSKGGAMASAGGGVLRCQRAAVLVLSSAAMQLLQPAELQAAMSGALAPLALDGECELCCNELIAMLDRSPCWEPLNAVQCRTVSLLPGRRPHMKQATKAQGVAEPTAAQVPLRDSKTRS
jgi:hypothetical protein